MHSDNRNTQMSQREGQIHAQRVLACSVAGSSQGTQSSNTVPSNCITKDSGRILRCGIDSLYLSYWGEMSDESSIRLTKLKELAKSDLQDAVSLAQLTLNDRLFEVAAYGKHPYAYVLKNHSFRLQVSKQAAKRTPLAYCKISSEMLTNLSPDVVVADLSKIVSGIGYLTDAPKVSRADLCVDFTTDFPIDQIQNAEWVTKARSFAQYTDDRRFSGFAIAAGGVLSARLYNKTLELKKNPRPYLETLWLAQGWDGVSDVWRLEFQFQRQALRDFNVDTYQKLIESLAGLWNYATLDWLRHTVPNPNDKTQTRWPSSSLWKLIQEVQWNGINELQRKDSERSKGPTDRSLFINGLSPLTSFMAREQIFDVDEAGLAFINAARGFHNKLSIEDSRSDFESYVSSKVREKIRAFSIARNLPVGGGPHPADKAVADDYRKRSNGDY